MKKDNVYIPKESHETFQDEGAMKALKNPRPRSLKDQQIRMKKIRMRRARANAY